MRHPLESLDARLFRRFYLFIFVATLAVGAVLQGLGGVYAKRPAADGKTYDVIALEFAGTPAQVEIMKQAWGVDGVNVAISQTWLDYLFLVCYSTAIAMGCIAVVSNTWGFWAALGRWLAWGAWLAALMDAIENAGLLLSLYGVPAMPWPQLAFVCAAIKFALVGMGLLYILAGIGTGYRQRPAIKAGR